jgi:hypothetical protein
MIMKKNKDSAHFSKEFSGFGTGGSDKEHPAIFLSWLS